MISSWVIVHAFYAMAMQKKKLKFELKYENLI